MPAEMNQLLIFGYVRARCGDHALRNELFELLNNISK